MDTEHWFAPMYDTYVNPKSTYDNNLDGDFLYLSTDAVDDFEVIIYSGESVVEKVILRNDHPKYIKLPFNLITTVNPADTFLISKKGLHLVGTQRFMANLRLLRGPDAEMITSKGLAGIGTDFFAIMPTHSIQWESFTSQVNIIATENNTSVKIGGYNPDITFLNHKQISELTIKLNKGESYMAVVPYRRPNISTGFSGDPYENGSGLMGANIHSDKPVSITNGSFNTTFIYPILNTDILMDQAIPVSQTGKEYLIAKGNGKVDVPNGGGADMERIIILATKDGTKVKVNDSPTEYLLNKGESKILYATNFYKNQGSGIYNMYIKSNENIYAYQLFAGSDGITDNFGSGSMSLVPAVNCLLPKQMISLPSPNQIGSKDDFNSDINIFTRKGAEVHLNGDLLNASNGPYPVSGTAEWVLFKKKGIKGNITIFSTEAIVGAFVSGFGEIGYGGFFTGFNSVPQIVKTGSCSIGTKLQVYEGYDSYEWYFDNKLIASGNNLYFIDPEKYGSGNYYCKVSKKICGDFITSLFFYNSCPPVVSPLHISNIITPNADGVNDFVDYSGLMKKNDPKFEIYDRHGSTVFKGNSNNRFIWNGKQNDRPLPTSSYWYILEWNEIGNPKRQQYTGWILLKNRN